MQLKPERYGPTGQLISKFIFCHVLVPVLCGYLGCYHGVLPLSGYSESSHGSQLHWLVVVGGLKGNNYLNLHIIQVAHRPDFDPDSVVFSN